MEVGQVALVIFTGGQDSLWHSCLRALVEAEGWVPFSLAQLFDLVLPNNLAVFP